MSSTFEKLLKLKDMGYNGEQQAPMVSEQQHKVMSMTAPIFTDKQSSMNSEDFENQMTDILETLEQNSEKSQILTPSGGVFKKPVAKA